MHHVPIYKYVDCAIAAPGLKMMWHVNGKNTNTSLSCCCSLVFVYLFIGINS